ncbi:penicillin acylase family protein [Halorubellus sp. JP-L1]|uniref:penicillin acylase family protein n=1 Tax=Halorubellus sp. JP-L1 TaxID=2715753 RepID=UPI00187882FC|nr:penicillin acylase family protein [Halorubellus sp. JP-L1]
MTYQDNGTTRRSFLKASAGAVGVATTAEVTLAYERDGHRTTVQVRRDENGVPHVYAPGADSRPPVFYGYGYAAAEDRLFQLEMYRRFYHGTVSEVLGPGATAEDEDGPNWVAFDRAARLNRSGTDVSEQIETQLDDEHRAVLEAFADGINQYVQTVRGGEREFHRGFIENDFEPEPWDREDVAGVFVASMAYFSGFQLETFGASLLESLRSSNDDETAMELFEDIQWGEDPGAPTSGEPQTEGYVPPFTPAGDSDAGGSDDGGDDDATTAGATARSTPGVRHAPSNRMTGGEHRLPADAASAHESQLEHWRTLASGLDQLGLPIKLGSNALAVQGEQTESGDALLMGGPQMGFSSPSVMHEVGLHGADFDVTGITVAGYPFVMFGHNGDGALTSTAGIDNSLQTFVETIRAAPDGADHDWEYDFQGEWLPVESTTETISVKGGEDVEQTIRRTRHGYVADWQPPSADAETGEAVAVTRSYEGLDMNSFKAFYGSQFASDAEEFVERAQVCDYSLNFMWAGADGDVAYVHGGRYPDNESVSWDTRLPADGTQYELTEDDYLRAVDGEVPFVVNPSTGYVAQWNNKPAPAWDNGDLSYAWGTDHRVQRIINLVEHRLDADGAVSYDFLKDVVYDIAFVDLRAIRYKEPLVDALSDADLSDTEQAAADALASWNDFRQGDGEDHLGDYPVGYTVFDAVWPKVLEKTFRPAFGPVFDPARGTFFDYRYGRPLFMRALHADEVALPPARDYFAMETDDSPAGRDAVFRAAFSEAVSELESEYETSDVSQWRASAQVEPLNNLSLFGVPIGVGDAGDMPFLNRGTENHFVRCGGDGGSGGSGKFRAENVLPPGNSGYVAPDGTRDEHYADQLEDFVDFEYKTLRFYRSEVMPALDTLTVLMHDDDGGSGDGNGGGNGNGPNGNGDGNGNGANGNGDGNGNGGGTGGDGGESE